MEVAEETGPTRKNTESSQEVGMGMVHPTATMETTDLLTEEEMVAVGLIHLVDLHPEEMETRFLPATAEEEVEDFHFRGAEEAEEVILQILLVLLVLLPHPMHQARGAEVGLNTLILLWEHRTGLSCPQSSQN
ncbi:hypothetical protein B0H11DRAFT_2248990 [Mycena galericulata]|nr:hypothetical protein B0H11DRAFT_2248990 [Mycena galericulata]